MTTTPIISGRDCINALCCLGYREIRQRGSHVRLVCEQRSSLTVPLHAELRRGTLHSILRTADVSLEELLQFLK
jgi:predicted RNA binding protein YcfA (HicA-like mRNA interferase family)